MVELQEKTLVVHFPMYSNYKVNVILSNSVKESALRLNKTHGMEVSLESISGQIGAMNVYKEGEQNSILILPLDATVGEIAHESFHAIRRLFRFISAGDDEELLAYHIDYLVQTIWNFKEENLSPAKVPVKKVKKVLDKRRPVG
jgi:hypothetical protein